MKYLPIVAGILLGIMFAGAGIVVLLNLAPAEAMPEGSPAAHFMAAFVPTGYLTFVKVLEVVGGVLVAVPRTRNIGLLVLGPILLNIVAFHVFVTRGEGLLNPSILIMALLSLFLLWVERPAFAGLVTRASRGA
ncbi:MAG: DoxX family protein [Verrucomicrobiae bacterium]|nr:DoxX family protein [Verrucomicrobiae bacterium]